MLLNFYNQVYFGFTILLLNIFIYIFLLSLIFLILFLFDLKSFKSLTDFKFIGNTNLLSLSIFLSIASLAGVPPLFGFCGKFFFFIYIFLKKNLFLCFLASLLNVFYIFFYIQNLRFLNTGTTKFLSFNFVKNENVYLTILFFTFINTFSFLFIEDIYLNFFLVSSFIF